MRQGDGAAHRNGLACNAGDQKRAGIARRVVGGGVEDDGRVFVAREDVWQGGQFCCGQFIGGGVKLDFFGVGCDFGEAQTRRCDSFDHSIDAQAGQEIVATARSLNTDPGRLVRLWCADVSNDAVDQSRVGRLGTFDLNDAILGGQNHITLLDDITRFQGTHLAICRAQQGTTPNAYHLATQDSSRLIALGNRILQACIAGCRLGRRGFGRSSQRGSGSGRLDGGCGSIGIGRIGRRHTKLSTREQTVGASIVLAAPCGVIQSIWM